MGKDGRCHAATSIRLRQLPQVGIFVGHNGGLHNYEKAFRRIARNSQYGGIRQSSQGIDKDKISPTFQKGVLKIAMPKSSDATKDVKSEAAGRSVLFLDVRADLRIAGVVANQFDEARQVVIQARHRGGVTVA